jgi:2-dehydropantoate 2-reductase
MKHTIAVVGPGAIGTTVAAALYEAGHTPMLCGRTPREHLALRRDEGTFLVPGPVRIDPAKFDEKVDLVFFAVKATQIEAAAPWLAALCHPSSIVCVLENGVEQESMVSPFVPACPVVSCVVWFPAEAQSDGSVRLRGEASLTLPDNPAAHVVQETLRGSWCTVDLAADFTTAAWRKLLQNVAAGLLVLSGRRAGMFARADIAELSLNYLKECLEVARAEGANLGDEVPQEILDGFQSRPTDSGTSILADSEAHRPLEWRTRNEVIVRHGRAHGIATPISDVVVPLLATASDGPG